MIYIKPAVGDDQFGKCRGAVFKVLKAYIEQLLDSFPCVFFRNWSLYESYSCLMIISCGKFPGGPAGDWCRLENL